MIQVSLQISVLNLALVSLPIQVIWWKTHKLLPETTKCLSVGGWILQHYML